MTSPVSPAIPAADFHQGTPKKIEDAAQQFEALLIGQMLRSARQTGWDDDDDSSSTTMLDVADDQFSRLLATHGGFGMARLIVQGLRQGGANENQ